MRKIKELPYAFSSILLGIIVCVFSGCNHKCGPQNGVLKIAFENNRTNLEVSIYTIENELYPILIKIPDKHGRIETELLPGQYIIKPYAPDTYYEIVGVQILFGKKTVLNYDETNQANYKAP